MSGSIPAVLSLAGHDPTGGAGIQADIETLFRLGCHPCTVITALTRQDSGDVRCLFPQDPSQFRAQAEMLLADLRVSAIKIGLLGSAAIAGVVAELLADHAGVPVVLDPVLAAGGGKDLASAELSSVLNRRLLPRATLLTPNTDEARRLTGLADLDDCAGRLLDSGCRFVLITGTHDDSEDVVNRLYDGVQVQRFHWPRLPGSYHGSGCTLASAAAAFLGRGFAMERAVYQAQRFTWESLRAGYRPGRGQSFPNRRCLGPDLDWPCDEA